MKKSVFINVRRVRSVALFLAIYTLSLFVPFRAVSQNRLSHELCFGGNIGIAESIGSDPAKRFNIKQVPSNTSCCEIAICAESNGLVFLSTKGLGAEKCRRGGGTDFIGRYESQYYRKVGKYPNYRNGVPILGISKNSSKDLVVYSRSPRLNDFPARIADMDFEGELLVASCEGNRWRKGGIIAPLKAYRGFTFTTPVFCPDRNSIIFASNLPGGYGGFDLYEVVGYGDHWGPPRNLGPDINSANSEWFPAFDVNGTLFFASNRPSGFGGFDIYWATRESQMFKLGGLMNPPFNSEFDDLGLVFEANGACGYFSSNRSPSLSFDVFNFQSLVGLQLNFTDSLRGGPVSGVRIKLKDQFGKSFLYVTDANGNITHFCIPNTRLQLELEGRNLGMPGRQINLAEVGFGTLIMDTIPLFVRRILSIVGRVEDRFSNDGLESVEIVLKSPDKKVVDFQITDKNGLFSFSTPFECDLYLEVLKEGYQPQALFFDSNANAPNAIDTLSILLKKSEFVFVEGSVAELLTGSAIGGVSLRIIDNNTQRTLSRLESDVNGNFYVSIELRPTSDYSIVASKTGYFSSRIDLEWENRGIRRCRVSLNLAEYGADKVVKVIPFDYDKSNLQLLSKKDLNEISYFLLQNSEAILEVGAHTDSRGGRDYNLSLSKKRAEEVVHFILARSEVDPTRLRPLGYGESRLTNNCGDNVPCTEEEHKANRRAELRVLSVR